MKKIAIKYGSIVKIMWKQTTYYRFDFIFGLLCGFLPVIALIMLWNAVYDGKPRIGGYTQSMMISYVVYARFMNIVLVPEFFFEVIKEIQSGDIVSYLCKPMNYTAYWFFKTLGEKSKEVMIGLISILGIGMLSSLNFTINLDVMGVCFFFVVVAFAYILYFLIFMMISVVSFWFYDISSWYYTVVLAIELLAGVIVPVALFPQIMRTILEYTPFQYLVSFPIHIIIGSFGRDTIIKGMVTQMVWIAILSISLHYIWKKGIKKFEANGG